MNFNERQIPPPKYWQQFEDLCLSLFRNIWGDPTAQKNGRSGQTQHGTDVWGGADYDGGAFHGVQCKGKDIGLGAAVTENELRSEVEKAKQFTPQLSHWILATTAPKDAGIEAVAREITMSHKADGLFTVQVLGWEDLQSLIAKYPDVIQEFYPEQAPAKAAVPDSIEMIGAAKKAASDALEEFGFRLKEQPIAPLLAAAPGEMAGTNLIATLSEGDDMLLLGRSGLGKSFHLEHYRRRCLELGAIPMLLHAGHYSGDLNRAIHRTIGPYTSLTPGELLDAARRVGKRLALIVDDWNKCMAPLQGDLSNDLASFQLRYGVRIAIASQQRPPQPFFTKFKGIELAALRSEQKNQIFSFHAAAQEIGSSCAFSEAFSTAFDLSIAGRSCKGGSFPDTRWELYDNYVRLRLPSAAARATARQLAWFMGDNFRPFLIMAEFERIGERIASDLKAPITVVDEVLRSGLMIVEADTVAFEHDLLKDFFRAEFLLRDAAGLTLVERLLEPKYADLAEFVAPNIAEEDILRRFLDSANAALLSMGFRGNLGRWAQTAIRQQCGDLLVKTRDNLPKVEVEAVVGEFPDGRKFVSAAHTDLETSASTHEVALCSVIANNLDNRTLREAFLELLDLGEEALRASADNAAKTQRLKPLPVWRELIRLNVVLRHSGPIHPLLLMCVEIRDKTSFGKSLRPSPLHEGLFERTRAKGSCSLAQLLLMSSLRYSESIDVDDVVHLFSQAWSSGVYILQMEALDFVHSCAAAISKQGQQAESRIIEALDSIDVSKNVMLSTQWVETRAAFTDFDCGITTDDALIEYRRILAVAESGEDPLWEFEHEQNPTTTFLQFVGGFASSALGKIFEDVFQGAYSDAYEQLTAPERKQLLTLALQDERSHMFQAWYLRELRKLGCEDAKDILVRLGSRIDGDAFCPQETVETFVIANEAWATISETPIRHAEGASPDQHAWTVVGELVFWLGRCDSENKSARITVLFRDLIRRPQLIPDILRHLSSGYMGLHRESPLSALLIKHREDLRALLNYCLEYEGRLTSAFKGAEHRQRELFSFVISTLGEIGDADSVTRLRAWTDHSAYGRHAIRAIETIEQRKVLRVRV